MYLIDSDVLITSKNGYYAFDIVPGFWNWLEQEHRANKVFVAQSVADEVIAGSDELAVWMKAQPASFRLTPGDTELASLKAVSEWAHTAGFKDAAVSAFLSGADYFNVAQAGSLDYCVVTLETPDPNSKKRIKIPDACEAMGVKWMNLFKMLKHENAQFHLK